LSLDPLVTNQFPKEPPVNAWKKELENKDRSFSDESMREVRAEAKSKKQKAKNGQKKASHDTSYLRRRRFRNSVRRFRFGIGALLSLASGAMLVGAGVLPWTKIKYEDFAMEISASTLYGWLPVYAIVAGLIIVGLTVSGSGDVRTTVGTISLVTSGITAYIWSEINSLLNIVSGFGGLFSDNAVSINLQDYLKPEIGLILWAGSAVAGFVAYLFSD